LASLKDDIAVPYTLIQLLLGPIHLENTVFALFVDDFIEAVEANICIA